jgi:(R,R)-butanediol dehydrogenase / meso-butanediol dehydrogenase / diacetyl reductase
MLAVRLHGEKDLRVEDVAAPKDLGADQVLLRPEFCGICGTDLHEYRLGSMLTSKTPHPYSGASLPQILGHEFAGAVVEVGRDVTHVKPGDRVSIQPQIGPRTDYFGRRDLFHLGPLSAIIGLSWAWGGMAEEAVVNDYNAIKLPDGVTNEQGAMIEPAACAVQAVERAGLRPGDSVLVAGAGPIGALVVLAAQAAGAAKIFVTEPLASRRRRLSQLGLGVTVLEPTDPRLLERIRDETEEGLGVDVALECAGSAAALTTCIDAVRKQGTVVVVGVHHGSAAFEPLQWLMKDIAIRGSLCYPLSIWPRIISMIQSGRFPVERLIDGRIAPKDAVGQGFDALLEPGCASLKILINFPQ